MKQCGQVTVVLWRKTNKLPTQKFFVKLEHLNVKSAVTSVLIISTVHTYTARSPSSTSIS